MGVWIRILHPIFFRSHLVLGRVGCRWLSEGISPTQSKVDTGLPQAVAELGLEVWDPSQLSTLVRELQSEMG